MTVDFTSVRNNNERSVCDAVLDGMGRYPGIAHNQELLADVACVALNRLQPRYIRHTVDFSFYLTEQERHDSERQVADAVEYAFGFVQARAAMRARVNGPTPYALRAPPQGGTASRPAEPVGGGCWIDGSCRWVFDGPSRIG